MASTLEAAQQYLRQGWFPVPVPTGKKRPVLEGWQLLRLSPEDLPQYFSNGANIGLLLGVPSGGLIDVDLDASEAVAAAANFLPRTDRVHGRPGKPRSHFWYQVSPTPNTQRFVYVEGKEKTSLVELRSTGGQTLVPPSEHPSRESYEWYDEGEPAKVDAQTLIRAVEKIAACALLARKWPGEGSRNDAANALAGGLIRAGWSDEEVATFIEAVTRIAEDEEARDRIKAGRYTKGRIEEGGKATGLPTLGKLVGGDAVKRFAEWLHLGGSNGNGRATTPRPPEMTAEGQENNDAITDPSGLYVVKDGSIGHMKTVGRGDDAVRIFIPLANFTAQVTEEVSRDNGVEIVKTFGIEGRLNDSRPLHRIEIPASQFGGLSWVTALWGIHARISAGLASKDRLREAIQVFSGDAKERKVCTHTGWRKMDGEWVYLHGGGAISAGGLAVNVDLEPPLDRYRLPEPPEDIPGALAHSLALLNVAPYHITVPLLSSVYLAPLAFVLRPDFGLWPYGRSGALKSTLAALFLSHYGDFPDKKALPATWESTENAIEKRLFMLKDTLCVVDDYAPQRDPTAKAKLFRTVQRIVRAQGNLSGRSRMRADTSLRPDYPPRGLMIATAEDLPPGQSILARLLTVEMRRSQIDMKLLTEAQGKAHRLPHAMTGFLQYLAPQMDELIEKLPERWKKKRNEAGACASHLRGPEVVAHLSVGFEMFLKYAQNVGVVSEEQADRLYEEAWGTLILVSQVHDRRVMQEDPATVFLSTIVALLAEKVVRLSPRDGSEDIWEDHTKVGWQDTEYCYLLPDAVRVAVLRRLKDMGLDFPHSSTALYQVLVERGAMIPGGKKSTYQLNIGGKNHRVMRIRRGALEEAVEEGE